MLKLNDVTALVGANGCGKSAGLHGLARLFGTSPAERTLIRADFHLPPRRDWDDLDEATRKGVVVRRRLKEAIAKMRPDEQEPDRRPVPLRHAAIGLLQQVHL